MKQDNKNVAEQKDGLFGLIGNGEKLLFLKHFIVYFLAVVVSAISNNHIVTEYQWWLVLSLGWGVLVLVHFIYLFIIKPRIILYRDEAR